MNESIRIVEAADDDIQDVRLLFEEYQRWLNVDLCFQNFNQELADLPGKYASPDGILLLAKSGDRAVGCVGLSPLSVSEAELKRLYVQEPFRGSGAGKSLFTTVMERAPALGYSSVVLDTLARLTAARSLYEAYGFTETSAYYDNPETDVVYYRYTY